MNSEEYNEMELNGAFYGCNDHNECFTVNHQYANISVPIELKPTTTTGDITIECCEEPTIECRNRDCENSIDIVITQKVCVKIPIKYQIDACVGEDSISCC